MAETASQYRLSMFDTIRGETDRQTRDDGYNCTMQYATATWHVRAKYVSLDAERAKTAAGFLLSILFTDMPIRG